LHRTLTSYELEAIHGKSVNGVPVLNGAASVGAVVDPNSIDEKEVLSPREAPYEGTSMTMSGFLDHNAWSISQRFRHCPKPLLAKLLCCYDPDGAHGLERVFADTAGSDNGVRQKKCFG